MSSRKAYRTSLDNIKVDESGWFRIRGGFEITKLPIVEKESLLFARLGHGVAGDCLRKRGWALPSVSDYEEMHRLSYHIEPVVLPDEELLAANNIKRTQAAIQAFRVNEMMSYDWCVRHDNQVWGAMQDWQGRQPIDNCGKHWAAGGLIVGWWTPHARKFGVKNNRMIQPPSAFHRGEPTYVDYATTFHAVRVSKPHAEAA